MAWNTYEALISNSSTAGPGIFYLKQFLVATGWAVVSSSDGISNWGMGDNILNDATGAFGIRNNNAWLILEDPASLRQMACSFLGNVSSGVRITYSPRVKYTGGSLLTPPAASDAVEILGNGSGGIASWPLFLDTFAYFLCVAEDTPINGVYPFHFWWIRRGGAQGAIASVAMCALVTGTYSADDLEPLFTYAGAASPTSQLSTGTSPSARTFVKFGDPVFQTWATCQTSNLRNTVGDGYLSSANNYDSATVEMHPVAVYARGPAAGAPLVGVAKNQYKGIAYDLVYPLRTGLIWPQVIGEGTPGGWLPAPGDAFTATPGPHLAIPWPNSPRPRY